MALVARGSTPLRPPVQAKWTNAQSLYCWSYDRNHAAAESDLADDSLMEMPSCTLKWRLMNFLRPDYYSKITIETNEGR